VTLALVMRAIPFEYRQEIFQSLYGDPTMTGPTETVGGVVVEKSTMDTMREMRDKAAARRQSRTEGDGEN
jgi:hypothetical protein